MIASPMSRGNLGRGIEQNSAYSPRIRSRSLTTGPFASGETGGAGIGPIFMHLFASDARPLLWISLAFYAASLLFALWRLAVGMPYRHWPKLGIVLAGFSSHTLFLWERGLSRGHCPVSNLFETLIFIAWCLVALHLAVSTLGRINSLTAFYMPLVIIVQMAALIAPTDQPHFERWKESSWLGLHASVIMLGYAAFGLAGAVALMYLVQERQLRTRRLGPSFMILPPILRLEVVQSRLLVAGFCLLTLGLLSGIAGSAALGLKYSKTDAMLIWSGAVWVMYLVLLAGRFVWGLSGRRMAWLGMTACGMVLVTFWLASAFSQFHNY